MANAALIFALVGLWAILWIGVSYLSSASWYKTYLKYHYSHGGGGRSHGFCSRLPKIPGWVITEVWALLYVAAIISLYYYFVGNCQFDKFKIFVVDDEATNPNSTRGVTVMVLCILDFLFICGWKKCFFNWRCPLLGTFIATLALAANSGILWAMGTTEICPHDDFTNRFWMCFGLWLAYSSWWIVIWFVSIIWLKVEGWKIQKNHKGRIQSKMARFQRKRTNYQEVESDIWRKQYSQNVEGRVQSKPQQGGQHPSGPDRRQQQQQQQHSPQYNPRGGAGPNAYNFEEDHLQMPYSGGNWQ